ncbi:hypothetical protein DdX_05642 [Ditylenchus destructor]|uniref:Mitochondrial mRNA-processing protein COX24 C-terminal domain-containing protein n=1 Tax=Ditylenchus destructor TaxID=166010 RepID=A0AAD4N6I1_9BILA|nr:hypothetical protein DdX_05642 [Ditylenchus destructor]
MEKVNAIIWFQMLRALAFRLNSIGRRNASTSLYSGTLVKIPEFFYCTSQYLPQKYDTGLDVRLQTAFDALTIDQNGMDINNKMSHMQPKTARAINDSKGPISLPAFEKRPKLYSFPTPAKLKIEAPAYLPTLIEKMDPIPEKPPVEDPQIRIVPMEAHGALATRMKYVRKHKMKKHMRIKRWKKFENQYKIKQAKKKAKSEHLFRSRLWPLIQEIKDFNELEYVKDTIEKAKKDWNLLLAPSGRRRHPHWSRFCTLEEIFEHDLTDHIDKRYGFPSDEDREKIERKKAEYIKKYTIDNIPSEPLVKATASGNGDDEK